MVHNGVSVRCCSKHGQAHLAEEAHRRRDRASRKRGDGRAGSRRRDSRIESTHTAHHTHSPIVGFEPCALRGCSRMGISSGIGSGRGLCVFRDRVVLISFFSFLFFNLFLFSFVYILSDSRSSKVKMSSQDCELRTIVAVFECFLLLCFLCPLTKRL